jgi:hypothetical protein
MTSLPASRPVYTQKLYKVVNRFYIRDLFPLSVICYNRVANFSHITRENKGGST